MMGMSSACSNPVLYGWLNENFWKEFKDIMCISSSSASGHENDNRLPNRKPSRKMVVNTNFLTVVGDQHGATAVTEMSMLTKC